MIKRLSALVVVMGALALACLTDSQGQTPARPKLLLVLSIDQLKKGEGEADFLNAKIATARFYADHILAQAPGLAASVTGGAESVLSVEEAMRLLVTGGVSQPIPKVVEESVKQLSESGAGGQAASGAAADGARGTATQPAPGV